MLRWFWKRWLRQSSSVGSVPVPSAVRRRTRKKTVGLLFELLEDRLVPATFVVNSFADTDAVDLVTGKDQTGNISVRSAIEAANSLGGTSTINLGSGTYALDSHFNAAGQLADLTIVNRLNIVGAGINQTTIDGGALGRVFQIAGSATVNISGVLIANGLATDQGGAISNAGNLTLTSDLLNSNNVVANAGLDAKGGAIFNANGAALTLSNTQIMNSNATGGDGAAGVDGSSGTTSGQAGAPGTPGSNGGRALGGSIYNDGGTVTVSGSVVTGSTAAGGVGGTGGAGGGGVNNAGGSDANLPGTGGAGANGGGGGQSLGARHLQQRRLTDTYQ